MNLINSGFTGWVYNAIIRYSALQKGITTNDFWEYFDKADASITSQSFYQPYLVSSLHNTYKNLPDQIPVLASRTKNGTHPIVAVDTIYQLAAILSKTKNNYKAAKAELDNYSNGRFAFLLSNDDELHREQRTIQSLAPVNLIDFSNKKLLLQKLLNDKSAEITVLDFWASWCVPCIADYPMLKKTEQALKGKPVRFISISIDVEEDKPAWINRTRQLKTFNTPNQFRLENPRYSPINKFFNLYSIPRYIVIDKNGKILEEEFNRPNEPAFQRKLETYLRAFE